MVERRNPPDLRSIMRSAVVPAFGCIFTSTMLLRFHPSLVLGTICFCVLAASSYLFVSPADDFFGWVTMRLVATRTRKSPVSVVATKAPEGAPDMDIFDGQNARRQWKAALDAQSREMFNTNRASVKESANA